MEMLLVLQGIPPFNIQLHNTFKKFFIKVFMKKNMLKKNDDEKKGDENGGHV